MALTETRHAEGLLASNVGAVSHVVLIYSPTVSEAGEAPYITSAGFQFLLLDTASQLWYFTLQYLKTAQVCLSTTSTWSGLNWSDEQVVQALESVACHYSD